MKTVGIIGGFGPETTAKFFMQILSSCSQKKQVQRPEILIWNAPVNEKLEAKFIAHNESHDHFRKLLRDGAKQLKNGGADFLVLPCNSLHVFINDLESVNLPVTNIIEETEKFFANRKIKSIGLLASSVTIQSGLFKRLNPLLPDPVSQKDLDRIILRLINNKSLKSDATNLQEILDTLRSKGANHILLGCTDLQLIITKNKSIIDSLEILKEATVNMILLNQ